MTNRQFFSSQELFPIKMHFAHFISTNFLYQNSAKGEHSENFVDLVYKIFCVDVLKNKIAPRLKAEEYETVSSFISNIHYLLIFYSNFFTMLQFILLFNQRGIQFITLLSWN